MPASGGSVVISLGDAVAPQREYEHLMTVDTEALELAEQFLASSPGFNIRADEITHPIVCARCNTPKTHGWTRPRHGTLCTTCATLSGQHPDIVGSTVGNVLIGMSSSLWVYVGSADSLTIIRAKKENGAWPKGAGTDPRVSLITCPSVASRMLALWHTQYDLLASGHKTWTCHGSGKSIKSFATLTLSHQADNAIVVISPDMSPDSWYARFAGISAMVNLHDVIPALDACAVMDVKERASLRTNMLSSLRHGEPWEALLLAKDVFPNMASLRETATHGSVMIHHVLCWMILVGLQ